VSAATIGAADLGTLAAGKRANFIAFSSNPLEKITNSRDIDRVFVSGHDIDRLEMIRKIQVERPTVSVEDQKEDAAIREKERQEAEDRNLKKYGKFPLAPQSLNVTAGLTVQYPKRAKATPSGAGPYRVNVQMSGASGADLQEFYSKVLPEARWAPAGECWEKANAAQPGKKWRLCTEPGNGQIGLNISVQ
jgi:hypothetical protein